MSCDTDFADVVALLTCDGTAGTTTFVDASPLAVNDFTGVNGCVIDAANVMFGNGAMKIGTAGNQVAYNAYSGSGLDMSALPSWTIEGWIYPVGLGAYTQIFMETNDYSPTFLGGIELGSGNTANIQVKIFGATTSPGENPQIPTPTAGVWHHFAIVKRPNVGGPSGDQYQLFIDGVGSGWTNSATPYTGPYVPWSGHWCFGGYYDVFSASFVGGSSAGTGVSFDEIRITANVARYTADFTPPIAPFPTIACAQTVPDLVGLSVSAAESAILAAFFTVGTETAVIDPSPPNTVVSQSPAAGVTGTAGDPIDFSYSEGVLVPDVVNTSLAVVAPGILAAADFVVGTVTYIASAVIISGNVISQSPAGGSFAAAGSAVNLVVSSGLPALTVPDIFGLSQADAETVLTSLGLVVGAVGSAPSPFVPPGTVQTQNPSPGTPVGPGTIVSFVLSLGTPAVGTAFDFEATVISQYANSPVIMQLVQNLNAYVDQSTNFANFFNFVWNVDTAVGFGLDIWGKIVGVSRLLQIPNTTDYVGFDNGTRAPPDWQSMGSDQPPQPAVGGALYTGYNATSTYILGDDAYRQLILAKAFANICTTTAPALNTILQNLYGPGTAWVLNTGTMAISYNLNFTPSAIQLAILEQSGVIPTPPGVSVVIITP